MESPSENETKIDFIKAFFDDIDSKIAYLQELYNVSHREEAQVLCSCYIDGLASAFCWPDERNNFCFVKVLKDYGGNDIFAYIHPKMLDRALAKLSERGHKWKAIHRSASLQLKLADMKLYEEAEILQFLSSCLDSSEKNKVSQELWRGSFASIVYHEFRIASVHGLGPPNRTTFEKTTFRGKPVPPIDFFMVHDSLKRIIIAARELSQKSGKWFGHDYKRELCP